MKGLVTIILDEKLPVKTLPALPPSPDRCWRIWQRNKVDKGYPMA